VDRWRGHWTDCDTYGIDWLEYVADLGSLDVVRKQHHHYHHINGWMNEWMNDDRSASVRQARLYEGRRSMADLDMVRVLDDDGIEPQQARLHKVPQRPHRIELELGAMAGRLRGARRAVLCDTLPLCFVLGTRELHVLGLPGGDDQHWSTATAVGLTVGIPEQPHGRNHTLRHRASTGALWQRLREACRLVATWLGGRYL